MATKNLFHLSKQELNQSIAISSYPYHRIITFPRIEQLICMVNRELTHWRSESGMERLVIEIEMTTGLDHITHDTAES